MKEITLEELLTAGCHFGHQVTRQNPKARDFVFEARDGIHIIDLAKTKEGLEEAAEFIKTLGEIEGSSIIVVGTKRQAQPVVSAQVSRAKEEGGADGLFSITNRWIGGILTNFAMVSKNFEKLATLQKNLASDEEKSKYTKREVGEWAKEVSKLQSFYGGVADMKKTPDALFIIDSHLEDLAIREARAMGIKTVAIVDTNADPEVVNYVIPANDDALGSLEIIVGHIMDAWVEGRKNMAKKAAKAEAKEEKTEKEPKAKKETKEKAPKAKKADK